MQARNCLNQNILSNIQSSYVPEVSAESWIDSSDIGIAEFEQYFAGYCGAKYGIAVNNGTVGLYLSLLALGIGKGDEVIVPAFCSQAVAYAVCYTGATPVFADVDAASWNIDIVDVELKISARTKCIIAVHLFGNPVDMQPLRLLAYAHELSILEDASQAYGSQYKGQRAGSLGHMAVFNFLAHESLGSTLSGMIISNDDKLIMACHHYKNLCFPAQGQGSYMPGDIGFTYRMRNLHAASEQPDTEKSNCGKNQRTLNGLLYQDLLQGIPGIYLQQTQTEARHAFWLNGIRVASEEYGYSRGELMAYLGGLGVETRLFANAMHKHPAMQKFGCDCSGNLPISCLLADTGFYLPSQASVQEKEVREICQAIREFVR